MKMRSLLLGERGIFEAWAGVNALCGCLVSGAKGSVKNAVLGLRSRSELSSLDHEHDVLLRAFMSSREFKYGVRDCLVLKSKYCGFAQIEVIISEIKNFQSHFNQSSARDSCKRSKHIVSHILHRRVVLSTTHKVGKASMPQRALEHHCPTQDSPEPTLHLSACSGTLIHMVQ